MLHSCLTLCDPIDGSPPSSPVPGILQERTLEWVAISLLQCMKVKSESEVIQSCPTRSDPIDRSLPGSSVHGFIQAKMLEWVAVSFSSPNPGIEPKSPALQEDSLLSEPPGKPVPHISGNLNCLLESSCLFPRTESSPVNTR